MQSKELLTLVQNVQAFNDLKSFEILREKYNNLIHSQAKGITDRYKALPVGEDDILNVLTFYFYEIIKQYDPESGVYFNVYVKQRLRWKAMNYAREMITERHKIMNYSVEFNDDLHDQEIKDESIDILDDIKSNYEAYNFLTENEKEVLSLMLQEYENDDICEVTGLSKSYLYKLKKNISKKLKNELGL